MNKIRITDELLKSIGFLADGAVDGIGELPRDNQSYQRYTMRKEKHHHRYKRVIASDVRVIDVWNDGVNWWVKTYLNNKHSSSAVTYMEDLLMAIAECSYMMGEHHAFDKIKKKSEAVMLKETMKEIYGDNCYV